MRWFSTGRAKPKSDPFRTVAPSGWLIRYSGEINSAPGCRHNLTCSVIDRDTGKTLLAEGFRPIAGEATPTHAIFCTVGLFKERHQPRCLFNLYLDLSFLESSAWQTWVAIEVCKGLKTRLLTCKERALLIRCRSESEFDWCLDDNTLDFNWLDDGNRYLRSALAEYEQIRQV